MTHALRSGRRLATVLTSIGLAAILASGSVLAGTPVTVGYRDHAYGGGAWPSSDKPQSKTWFADGSWWAGMFRYSVSPSISDYRIWKLTADKTGWTATTTVVDGRDTSHADYLWDQGASTLYVASVPPVNTSSPFAVPATPDDIRFFKYTYAAGAYTWSASSRSPGRRAQPRRHSAAVRIP